MARAVGEEAGGDHERAGEQHQGAVDDLARRHLPLGHGGLHPAQHADALALRQPGPDDADREQQEDRLGHADAVRPPGR